MLGIFFTKQYDQFRSDTSNNTPYFGWIQVVVWWVSYCQQQTKVATEFRTDTSSGLVCELLSATDKDGNGISDGYK